MLRVGIVLDSYTSSAWVAKVIEDIQSSGFARLELVILPNHSEQGKSSFLRKLRERFSLFHLYERWDYQRNKADHDALAPTDVASLLNAVPSISIDFKREGGSDNIPEDRLAKIRNYDLDVLFRFGSAALHGGIAGVARYGLWSFHYGDSRTNHSGPPLIWELVERNPVSGSSLEIFAKSVEGRRIIYQSHSSTDQISLYCSRNPVYWKTAEFALRCLREVEMRGMDYIQSLSAPSEQETGRGRGDGAPNNLQMILFMRRYLSRWLQARLASFQSGPRTRWFIAIRRRNAVHRFDDPSEYMLMPCSRDRFYADPFLFEKDGKTFLFFEDFRFAEGRAVISYCEIGSDGSPGAPVEVLRRSFHLSYPFVFEHEGEIYMIPETRGNRRVELYRATSFPTEWISEAVLLNDIHAVDATIQKVQGKFWMFAGVSNGKYSNSDELCLFFADDLKGPWMPHLANPVLSDVRRARPAGRLFYDEGRLIRPSQDCGKAYGYALVFSEVLTLNETEYKERQISRLEPGVVEGCVGTHTYNRTEEFEVVDRTLLADTSTMEVQ